MTKIFMIYTLICLLFASTYGFKATQTVIYTRNSRLKMMTDVSDIPSPSSIIQPFLNQPIGVQYTYSDFIEKLQNKYIESITFFNDGKTAIVADTDHTNALHPDNLHYVHILPNSYTYIMDIANKFHVHVDMKDVPVNFLNSIMGFVGQSAMYIGGYFLLMAILRSFMGGNGNMGNMLPGGLSNKNSGQLVDGSNLNVSFADVAGCDEAKFELVEIVDFLKSPTKYNDAGAKVPKGVLLEGSPGTGKTLLAKAVAAEANVPFLSASGSEFIEMFVGVGAARVRSLFEKAKENAPCVIFIDEIDAIGRQRGAGVAGGNDEREQTLNQILTNMDGFEENSGIVVLAATNRLDVLDSALIRPGRFDRKIKVALPDFEGRKQIAGVHFRNKKIDKELDFNELSSLTTGFSGADIANLANEAAIFSVRNNQTQIDRTTLLDAYEKITIGLNSNVQENDKTVVNLVSYHETGHALMTCLFPQFFDLRKVTINANKNGAGGYTLFTPKERYTKYATKKFLLANLIIALGGRAAEVYLNSNTYKTNVFDNHVFKGIRDLDITTGASNDLLQANRIAKDYITKYGFGDLFGLCEDCNNDQPFMGKELGSPRSRLSDNIRKDIDTQVAQLVEFAYKSALELIQLNEVSFMEIVDLLAKERIIEGEDIMKILEKNSEVVSFD